MPKQLIDYSNTIIYKIFCNDKCITDIYVGHTTNFVKRKYQHKILCNNGNKLKIYDIIRNNGGWENWNMIEIAKYNCQDATEARIREQEHYDLLKPSLNLIQPISNNEYKVLQIDNSIKSKDDFKNENQINNKFYCTDCDFKCCKIGDWKRHIMRQKHINNEKIQNDYKKDTKNIEKTLKNIQNENIFVCKCGNTYKYRTGLWRHKKKCDFEITNNIENINEYEANNLKISEEILNKILSKDDLIIKLLEQNGELQKSLIEMSKEKTITNSNNNNYSNNKTFNLNFFLNETCKDALNMSDFVNLIRPTLEDLENTGRKGYVEGITDLILKNLKALEQCKRPIHCSDLKRAVLYVKDKDKWEKEAEDKPILTNAIKCIAHENIKQIQEWKKKNPDCTDSESRKNNLYLKIVSNSMSGINEEECEKNMSKIISNVVKETAIEKI
jgi:hypothetical protein